MNAQTDLIEVPTKDQFSYPYVNIQSLLINYITEDLTKGRSNKRSKISHKLDLNVW